MSIYFSESNPEHLALLPPALRTDQRLAGLVDMAEADLISHYTVRARAAGYREVDDFKPGPLYVAGPLAEAVDIGAGLYVCLRGYHHTNAAQAEANFARAMRRAVAEVVRWRASQWRKEPLTVSQSGADGTNNTSFREDAEHAFPPSVERWLSPYDLRPVVWGL